MWGRGWGCIGGGVVGLFGGAGCVGGAVGLLWGRCGVASGVGCGGGGPRCGAARKVGCEGVVLECGCEGALCGGVAVRGAVGL